MTQWSISYPLGTIRKDGVEQSDLSEYVDFLRAGGTPDALQEPQLRRIEVTAWQLMQELIAQGLYASVDSAVMASGNQVMIAGWTRAPFFESDNPLTLQMGAVLGKDAAAMYALFQSAAGR